VSAIDFLRQFGAVESAGAWAQMVNLLEAMPAIGGDMARLVSQMRGLTPMDDKETIDQLLAQAAQAIVGGTFDFGSLTPDQVDEIMQAIARFGEDASAGAGAQEEYTRSVQIGRSITEIQANELIAIQETALVRLEQIKDGIYTWLSLNGYGKPPGGEARMLEIPVGGGSVTGGGLNLTQNIDVAGILNDAMIDTILVEVEQRLRQVQRGA
jgi:hypothetical protein